MLTLHIAALIALITIPPMIMLERMCLLEFLNTYECENRVRCCRIDSTYYYKTFSAMFISPFDRRHPFEAQCQCYFIFISYLFQSLKIHLKPMICSS